MKKVLFALVFLAVLLLLPSVLPQLERSITSGTNASTPTNPQENLATATIQEEVEESVEPSMRVEPEVVIQGEPALIVLENISRAEVSSLTLNNRSLSLFEGNGKVVALVGLDLRMQPGNYPLELTLKNGGKIRKTLTLSERPKVEAPLGIPEKLGGNTPESERNLVSTLAQEGAIISAIPTSSEKLWSGPFIIPVDTPAVVTSVYGYSRQTGSLNIAHKGTDYRANTGDPIYASNSGLVRYTDTLRNYGNTIVVDHGLGVHTIYMHLSEILVEEGVQVTKGELIGRAGETGYAFGPHLHFTIRINGISIDPEKFVDLVP